MGAGCCDNRPFGEPCSSCVRGQFAISERHVQWPSMDAASSVMEFAMLTALVASGIDGSRQARDLAAHVLRGSSGPLPQMHDVAERFDRVWPPEDETPQGHRASTPVGEWTTVVLSGDDGGVPKGGGPAGGGGGAGGGTSKGAPPKPAATCSGPCPAEPPNQPEFSVKLVVSNKSYSRDRCWTQVGGSRTKTLESLVRFCETSAGDDATTKAYQECKDKSGNNRCYCKGLSVKGVAKPRTCSTEKHLYDMPNRPRDLPPVKPWQKRGRKMTMTCILQIKKGRCSV